MIIFVILFNCLLLLQWKRRPNQRRLRLQRDGRSVVVNVVDVVDFVGFLYVIVIVLVEATPKSMSAQITTRWSVSRSQSQL